MATSQDPIDVYIEAGSKRTFAGALAWPGWCRSGRDEPSALQALFVYAPRYAKAMKDSHIPFPFPAGPSVFQVLERLRGGAGTDFGAPEAVPAYDAQPVDLDELQRLQAILEAAWLAFDHIAQAAAGKELRLGPRGGGRSLEKVIAHVVNAEASYHARLGGKFKVNEAADPGAEYARMRPVVLETLARSAQGEIPTKGPRGGLRWTPRYFVRRTAWHALDHAWEIEDRVV